MAPQVQNLQDIVAGLNSVYDPQRQAAQSGVATVNQNVTDATQGLNAAKDQAFGQITNNANAKGMLFSGLAPDQQYKYTAATFLPALTKMHSDANDNITKLQQAILGLNANQQKDAMGIQEGQKKTLSDYQVEQQKSADEQQKMAQQLAIAQMSNQTRLQAASISAAGNGGQMSQYQQLQAAQAQQKFIADNYKVMAGKGSGGGIAYVGPGGKPISAAQYANATGSSLVDTLSQDKTAYAQAARAIISGDWGTLSKIAPANKLPAPPAAIRNDPNKLAGWVQQNYSKLF